MSTGTVVRMKITLDDVAPPVDEPGRSCMISRQLASLYRAAG